MRPALLMLILILNVCGAGARERVTYYGGPAEWSEFHRFMQQQHEEDEKVGLSYLISGGVATVGGVYGYYAAEEIFSRSLFAITSTVGIAALGLGATVYWTGNEYESFYQALETARIPDSERNQILRRYLESEQERRTRRKWIRVATHALIAAVNLYGAAREPSGDAQALFLFLGVTNTVLAVSYSF